MVLGSHMRPCKPSALDLAIAKCMGSPSAAKSGGILIILRLLNLPTLLSCFQMPYYFYKISLRKVSYKTLLFHQIIHTRNRVTHQ